MKTLRLMKINGELNSRNLFLFILVAGLITGGGESADVLAEAVFEAEEKEIESKEFYTLALQLYEAAVSACQ